MVRCIVLSFIVLLFIACGGGEEGEAPRQTSNDASFHSPPENNQRDWLTYEELFSTSSNHNTPYHNDYFVSVGENLPAQHVLNGTLTISGGIISGIPENFDGDPSSSRFPNLSFEMFSHEGYLIPVNRDIINPEGNTDSWRVILSPGKTWFEENDRGMSRASFPFVLVDESWNNTLNGLATFLYDDSLISNIRIQIVQHTSVGFTPEGAGLFDLSYMATPEKDNSQAMENFDLELSQQLHVESWQNLTAQYPNTNWLLFNSGIPQTDISGGGIWIGDTLYLQACSTLYGDFPYCRFMRHGVYSVTKSAAGAIALTHLAQLYGPEILDYYVKDYLDITAIHNGWNDITFSDLLNMAAGIGNNDTNPESSNSLADENQAPMGEWGRAKTVQQKLDITFQQYGNFPWQPGEIFRYNTTHTFVLSTAMDNLVKQREGIGLWQLLQENVYQKIGIQHSPMMHTNENSGSEGVPVLGFGLYPTVEDLVKISRLFHQSGMVDGLQILHSDTVNTALFRTDSQGLLSHNYDTSFAPGRYQMSFWGVPFESNEGCFMQVPSMNGYGGNLVTILPNGIIAVRLTDSLNYDTRSMVAVTGSLAPLCN